MTDAAERKARARVRKAQAEFERAQSRRDKASASRRKSFEQAKAVGLTVRAIAEETCRCSERLSRLHFPNDQGRASQPC